MDDFDWQTRRLVEAGPIPLAELPNGADRTLRFRLARALRLPLDTPPDDARLEAACFRRIRLDLAELASRELFSPTRADFWHHADRAIVAALTARYLDGELVDEIVVGRQHNRPTVLDGCHRLTAMAEAELDDLIAYELIEPAD